MAKMLVALAVVMMHGVMAKRSNNWLDDLKHLSVERNPPFQHPEPAWLSKAAEIVNRPLDVTASAVAFCGELLKEVHRGVPIRIRRFFLEAIQNKTMAAEDICPKVLSGSLGAADPNATKFAKKAVKVAQLDGKKHDFGRLDKVAWKKSLHRVCHDECHALVQGIKDKAEQMEADFDRLLENGDSQKSQSVEEICADRVVREVESEIMTCCARSCGWNNHSCMFWPLMNSTEQAAWESECCVEMNILNGSTRERLCDSTLSKRDKQQSNAIIDNRSNTAKDREMIGQDGDVSVGSSRGGRGGSWWPRWLSWRGGSFMETSSMRSFNGSCPPPLNLDQLHQDWKTDWKVMNLMDLKSPEGTQKMNTVSKCVLNKNRQPTINGCKVFQLLQAKTAETNSEEKQRTYDYKCLDDCHMQEPENVSAIMDKESSSSDGIVYIHKDTKWKSPKSTES